MKDHIFISHSSRDYSKVRHIVEYLESAGIKCWISSRDIPPGTDWAECIYDAIDSSLGLILLFSENANSSKQVRNELDIATDLEKTIIPVKLDDSRPIKGIRYFTGSHQWLDGSDQLEIATERILRAAALLTESGNGRPPDSRTGRKFFRRSWVAIVFLLATAMAIFGISRLVRTSSGGDSAGNTLDTVLGSSQSWDYATDILATSDGGFTATGTWDMGFWSEWWVSRFDEKGKLLWSWCDSLAGEDKPALIGVQNGVISIVGEYADSEYTGFPVDAVRLDDTGNVEWKRSWWMPWDEAIQPELAECCMNDDSLIYTYFTLRQLSGNVHWGTHQIMLDTHGDLVSRDTVLNSDTAYDLILLNNGDILRMFRERHSGGSGLQIVTPEGNVTESAVIGDSRSFINCGLQMPNGDILLMMTTDTYGEGKGDLTLMRLSRDLKLIWENVYGGDLADDATDALLLPSGDIIICGYTSSFGNGSRDGWILRVDGNGHRIWQRIVDLGGDEYISAVSGGCDNCLYTAGCTTRYGEPDAWIMKIGSDGSLDTNCTQGLNLFTENWEEGYFDQSIWNMGHNRNYSPVLHFDTTSVSWVLDVNNVPVETVRRFPLKPGLCLSAEVSVPDMPQAYGNNWLALGLTGDPVEGFQIDPGRVSEIEMRWNYTRGSNGQIRSLESTSLSDTDNGRFQQPDSLWLKEGEIQRFEIELCGKSVRYWVNGTLFHEDPVDFNQLPDSVAIYLWGNSGSVPHAIDNIRLFQVTW